MTSANPAFKSKMTAYVVTCWILAAFGGLMFGYDIGISGMFFRPTSEKMKRVSSPSTSERPHFNFRS